MKNIKLIITSFSLLTASIAFGFADNEDMGSMNDNSMQRNMDANMRAIIV